jgi:hypothetical protein
MMMTLFVKRISVWLLIKGLRTLKTTIKFGGLENE